MQTELADFIRETPKGQVADSILRKCVHCGFCSATCPTYQLLGNELDGPRGRIYLIKQVLEGFEPTQRTQLHLDRCLTCRSCETTCPSGVRYGELLEIGREVVEQRVPRTFSERLVRKSILLIVPNELLTRILLCLARFFQSLLPAAFGKKIPPKEKSKPWPKAMHSRKMIIHQGCIQRVTKPAINAAAARYLNGHSISAIRTNDACCGALGLHLGNRDFFTRQARKNIDAWWPHIQKGAEAIVSTASGCGVTIKEYGTLLKEDQDYAEKADKIASLAIDISEVERSAEISKTLDLPTKVAVHSPCTLQHGQKIVNSVEKILSEYGIETTQVEDAHMCCGSAGVYSVLQSELSGQLLKNKIAALERGQPDQIVTANIGCLMHLASSSAVPVKHWVEVVAPADS